MTHKIERAVFGPIPDSNTRRVIGSAKEPLLPQVVVAAGIGGEIPAR
jgi:hypothetical protein